MQKTFETPRPISLFVQIGGGKVTLEATETTTTQVDVEGPDAEEVTVEQSEDEVVVVAPHLRAGFFGTDGDLYVTVTLPLDSDLATRLGSADIVAGGRYGTVRLKSGSGDIVVDEVTEDAVVETGSGDIEVGTARRHLRVKAGSGDVSVGSVAGSLVISAGSGSVEVGATEEKAALKSGSGDLAVKEAHSDLSAVTGSGDVYVGRIHRGAVKARAASGDIHIGVPAGVPVWTDITCVAGSIRSDLEGAGQPQDGQDHIEIRATTVSGDVQLAQL